MSQSALASGYAQIHGQPLPAVLIKTDCAPGRENPKPVAVNGPLKLPWARIRSVLYLSDQSKPQWHSSREILQSFAWYFLKSKRRKCFAAFGTPLPPGQLLCKSIPNRLQVQSSNFGHTESVPRWHFWWQFVLQLGSYRCASAERGDSKGGASSGRGYWVLARVFVPVLLCAYSSTEAQNGLKGHCSTT